jgi:hypothetical protein
VSPQEPNWTKFYRRLGEVGPLMLRGVPKGLQWWVEETAVDTDAFFPLLQDAFYTYWGQASAERTVMVTLERWANNVASALRDFVDFSGETPQQIRQWKRQSEKIRLKPRADLVAELVACASSPLDDTGDAEEPGEPIVRELPFTLLPPGSSDVDALMDHYRRQAALQPRNEDQAIDWERLRMIASLRPETCYVGTDRWTGYVLFEFSTTGRSVLECPVEGNATYVLSGDWRPMIGLTKQALRRAYPDRCVRIIHREKANWLNGVRTAVFA